MKFYDCSAQDAILSNVRLDVTLHYNFLFSETHVEVISGKQEGVYAWVAINYALHNFDHLSTGSHHSQPLSHSVILSLRMHITAWFYPRLGEGRGQAAEKW